MIVSSSGEHCSSELLTIMAFQAVGRSLGGRTGAASLASRGG